MRPDDQLLVGDGDVVAVTFHDARSRRGISGGTDLLRGPCVTCTKFDRKIDMPIAEISGARRNEPRSGR